MKHGKMFEARAVDRTVVGWMSGNEGRPGKRAPGGLPPGEGEKRGWWGLAT